MKYIRVNENQSQIPSLLQGFNRRWQAPNLELIYLCYDADDVTEAVDMAINNYGGDVKIKSGGHCYEDFVFNEHTRAIIDVSPMNEVGCDPRHGFYVGAGGTNWDAFGELFRDYGKVLPGGSCYSVGLGGHICGGGYGLLSRLDGLTVDWLTGVEVVVKNSSEERAKKLFVSRNSKGEEADLFWAHTGGGGGNFGAVTRYYFRELPDAPQRAWISTYSFKWADLTPEILFNLLEWFAAFSRNTDNWYQFGMFKLSHMANEEIHLVIQTAINKEMPETRILLDQQAKELNDICKHRVAERPVVGHGGHFFDPRQYQQCALFIL